MSNFPRETECYECGDPAILTQSEYDAICLPTCRKCQTAYIKYWEQYKIGRQKNWKKERAIILKCKHNWEQQYTRFNDYGNKFEYIKTTMRCTKCDIIKGDKYE